MEEGSRKKGIGCPHTIIWKGKLRAQNTLLPFKSLKFQKVKKEG
jgi:hypothetical protein